MKQANPGFLGNHDFALVSRHLPADQREQGPGFKQAATTTTWKPKTQPTTSNSRPLPSTPIITSSNNSNQKEIQIQNENKEIKETKQIDIISNKLREGIDEMITNITILSNKSV